MSCNQNNNPETDLNHREEQVGQEQVGQEQVEEQTICRSERRRCPPNRYGIDEYVDLAAESEVCRLAYVTYSVRTCIIERSSSE